MSEQGSAERGTSRWGSYKEWTVLVVIAAVIGLSIWDSARRQYTLQVKCEPIEGGQQCALTHSSAAAVQVHACVDIKRVCSSGQPSTGSACFNGTIPAAGRGNVLIADREFSNVAACGTISAQTEEIRFPAEEEHSARQEGG